MMKNIMNSAFKKGKGLFSYQYLPVDKKYIFISMETPSIEHSIIGGGPLSRLDDLPMVDIRDLTHVGNRTPIALSYPTLL